jgi:hypothetical protein
VINRTHTEPANMCLGRTLRSFQEAYGDFARTGPGQPPPGQKRPLQVDSATPQGRPIAPRPPGPVGPIGAVRTGPAGSPTSILSPMTGPSTISALPDTQRRKRGRPSKKDIEDRRQRQIEARASVDLTGFPPIMPSPRGTFGSTGGFGPQGSSSEVPPSPIVSSHLAMSTAAATPRAASHPSSNGSGGSSGKNSKRGRPPKPSPPPVPQPYFAKSGQRAQSGDPVAGPSSRASPQAESSAAGALHRSADTEEQSKKKWRDILNPNQ